MAQLVALSGSTVIRVCGVVLMSNGTTNVTLSGGTGTACATTNVAVTGAFPLTAQTGFSSLSATPILFLTSGQELCVNNSAAVAIAGWILYEQS